MFDSINKKNVMKTRETIIQIVDTKKLWMPKYTIDKIQGKHKKSSWSKRSGLINSANLVELL